MTRDIRAGRILVAALQQAINEELPTRFEFYDHWLGPDGRRDGTLGMAPMAAVVGFLRTEGEGYHRVMAHAGALVAQWTWNDAGRWSRYWVPRLPRWWRIRSTGRRLVAVIADTCPATRAKATVSSGVVTLSVRESVFCSARERPVAPLCAFYAALLVAMFASVDLVVAGQMEECRARAERGTTCMGTFAVSSAP
ncbi:MAG: hypothetical protein O2917_05600 [Acidobacteria bacterium]|nr:hypothetical protein [Acidobacteriota bacterium]